jgi:predicted transcriptional regulator
MNGQPGPQATPKLIMDEIANNKTDWFDELSESQQHDVLEGTAEADRGEVFTHGEVIKIFEKWGLK